VTRHDRPYISDYIDEKGNDIIPTRRSTVADTMVGLEEAAKALGEHRSTVMRMVKDGTLEGKQGDDTGKGWQISKASIQKVKSAKK